MPKSSRLVTFTIACALLVPGIAWAKHYTLTLSTWGSPKHPQVTHFVPEFVHFVESRSNGQIKVRVFSGGEMVKEENVPTAIPQDTVDISLTNMGVWAGRVPETTIFSSPLWTWSMQKSRDELVRGNPVFDYFNKKLKAQGAIILSLFDIGPAVIAGDFKIRRPKDMKGHTIRVYSKGSAEVIQQLGGAPAKLGVGEVYTALQRHTVDAAMGGLGGAVGLKYYEVGKHVFAPMGAIGTLIHAYVMNKDKFNSLPPHLQKIILQSARDARNIDQQYLIDTYKSQLHIIKAYGDDLYVLKHGTKQWKAWTNALKPLAQKDEKSYPDALVKLVKTNDK